MQETRNLLLLSPFLGVGWVSQTVPVGGLSTHALRRRA